MNAQEIRDGINAAHERESEAQMAALMAASEERDRQTRLAAQVDGEAKAKVERPKVEHSEASPRDKFSGCNDRVFGQYDDTLDPISPNFDIRTWEA